MKSLVVFFLVVISIITFGQYRGNPNTKVGDTWIYSDSLSYGNGVYAEDSVKYFSFGCTAVTPTLAFMGNSHSPCDSVKVTPIFEYYNSSGQPTDTIVGSSAVFKDSTWSEITVLKNSTKGESYQMFAPFFVCVLKVELINHWGTLKNRKVYMDVIGKVK